jgi:hypothetical protein
VWASATIVGKSTDPQDIERAKGAARRTYVRRASFCGSLPTLEDQKAPASPGAFWSLQNSSKLARRRKIQHRQQRMNCDDDADQTKLTRGLDALTCGLDAIVSRIRRWRLLIGFLGVPFVGFVMADNAPSDSADLAMACHMARDAPNDSAFDTSLRLGGGSERYAQNGGTKDQRLHRGSPKKPAAASIALR